MREGGALISRAVSLALVGALGGAFACSGKSVAHGDDEGRGGPSGTGATGGVGGTSGAGALAGTGGAALCEVGRWETQPPQTAIMLVVEGSASMRDPLGDTGNTRWQAARDALLNSESGALVGASRITHFGLTVFDTPAEPTEATCLNEHDIVIPSADYLAEISAAYPTELPGPDLGAAVGAAVTAATERLLALDGYSTKAIILVIDGVGGTCMASLDSEGGESAATAAVAAAYEQGIYFWVIDAGGGEETGPLKRLALVGQGFDAAETEDLTMSTLRPDEIRNFLRPSPTDISCSLQMMMRIAADFVPLGRITLDGTELSYGDDWTVSDGVTIDLTPRVCALVANDDPHRMVAEFPCNGVTPI